jgi:alkaline phosphatase D
VRVRALVALGLLLGATAPAFPQTSLRSGPMVGYAEMREVLLWAQTQGPARVRFRYWDEEASERVWTTAEVETEAATAFVARAIADSVQPGRSYGYEVLVDGEPVPRPYPLRFQSRALWQWRGDPPPFRMALGSCFYVNDPPYDRPGEPYGGEYRILTALHRARPDLMVWLGDYVYLREADWNTRTGFLHRYTHTRALPELQPLLASTHHYAIWDDHDFGPNNSDRSFGGKALSREAFDLFWGNPPFGIEGLGGVTNTFEWSDVQVFLLDDRWDRAPNRRETGDRAYLGERQLEWLIDALTYSRATFKIVAVGGQVVSPLATFENYANYPDERAKLLEAIEREGIEGVLFVTGDRHFTELTRLERPGTYPLYDLTVSPLTAGAGNLNEDNPDRVEGTLVKRRNYALLDFSGPRTDRTLRITVHDVDGRAIWSHEIRASELR